MLSRMLIYGGLTFSLIFTAGVSRAATTIAFNILRQSDWEPRLMFQPAVGDQGDWSLKIFDSAGTLQDEVRRDYGYTRGIISFSSFEAVRGSTYRVEYKPSGTTDVSVYQLGLDAPTWSSAALQLSRAFVTPSSPVQVGTRATITWPVYPGTGSMTLRVTKPTSPFTTLYSRSADFTAGTFLTDPLPNGNGSIEVDYSRPMTGAATLLQQISGPASDLTTLPDVTFYSWQSSGFTVVPEAGSMSVIGAVALLGLIRRRRPHPARAS